MTELNDSRVEENLSLQQAREKSSSEQEINSELTDSQDKKSSAKMTAFKGDILFGPNGTAIIVQKGENDEGRTSEISKDSQNTKPNQAIHFVTILNSTSDQSAESVLSSEKPSPSTLDLSTASSPASAADSKQTSMLNFVVHTLAEVVPNASNDAKERDLLVRKLLNETGEKDHNKAAKRRPILMCFPCRLTFGNSESFVSHCSSSHYISPNERESDLLRHQNISSVIQETADGKSIICFLEPVQNDQIPKEATINIATARHLESTTPVPNIDRSVSLCEATTEDDCVRGTKDASPSTENVTMENASLFEQNLNSVGQEGSRTETESREEEQRTDGAGVKVASTSGVEAGEGKGFAADLSSPVKVESKVSPQAQFLSPSEVARVNRTIQMMTTTSQNQPRSSPLSSSNKASVLGKTNDSIIAGSGVTTVDPLFQMSLFQSRNSCKTLKCPRCNWHYKYRQTLDAHMKEKHAGETSDCIYCNANQPHPRLSRGESYACGYKPFKCEVCNYSTTTKGNLSIHMQSDKHLYNVKTLQHQQQNKDKLNGQNSSGSNNDINNQTGSALPSRLLAEKQEQFQNLQLQTRKISSPDSSSSSNLLSRSSIQSRKGGREFASSPSSTRHQPWRCELCNYETDIPRNLRIHMQSEKHSHNVALAGVAALKRQHSDSRNLVKKEHGVDEDCTLGDDASRSLSNSNSPSLNNNNSVPHIDQNSRSTMAALYYYLAAMQSSMQTNQPGNPQSIAEDKDKQQKQLLAQHQQLLVAQQYQQLLAQMAVSGDAGSSTSLLQQQILMQQQMQLWRQLLQQGDASQPLNNLLQKSEDVDSSDSNNPPTSNKFLFTCGVCCNFSCNDLESMCAHIRALRYPKTPEEENEWVTKSPGDGYLCRICNYSTQLKTNFSLHCKTEKHTSKLQLINHIREGGEANEYKVSCAISGTNMNKVTCNGCRHSAASIDKLRIHCSTDRHQGTLTMCHYLDKMLKDAELNKDLKTSEVVSPHHLHCRPCSFQSKFVIEMIQHMQCQNHQEKVQQEQQGNVIPTDIVIAEPDLKKEKMEDDEQNPSQDAKESAAAEEDERPSGVGTDGQKQIHQCQFCNFETQESNQLQLHAVTQHGAQSTIKCPLCPEYLVDTVQFQAHLIEVHKLTGQDKAADLNSSKDMNTPTNKIGGVLEAIQVPFRENAVQQTKRDSLVSSWKSQTDRHEVHSGSPTAEDVTPNFPEQAEMERSKECQAVFSTSEELQQHSQDEQQQLSNVIEGHKTMPANSRDSDKEESMGSDNDGSDLDAMFSNPRLLLSKLCCDPNLARRARQDPRFNTFWQALEPPFSCSTCEETFPKKEDLFNHLLTESVHKLRANDPIRNEEGNVEPDPSRSNEKVENEESRVRTISLPVGGAVSRVNEPYARGNSAVEASENAENQGISKSAHKRVLEDVGFDQVAHFVENRSSENREKAKRWKEERANQSNELTTTSNPNHEASVGGDNSVVRSEILHDTNTPENHETISGNERRLSTGNLQSTSTGKLSSLTCERCGKEFSNMWILKVHENKVHNMDMSPEMLEEFVQGYTKWYWDSFKQEPDDKDCMTDSGDTSDSAPLGSRKASFSRSPSTQINSVNGDKGFKHAALQALLKNYPTLASQMPPAGNEDQSKLQQQQALIQMLMASQAQSSMQQQHKANQGQDSNQSNASSIMNTLIDQLYGAAMHGAMPGFMDPMAVMALLQHQQQSRMAPPGGMNAYQLLAMRYLQHQQLQQLLMYPAMAAGAAGMPFMPSLAENSNQQQMLAAFAASLLNPGLSPDTSNPMLPNALSSAFHAYQLQAAASLGDNRAVVNDSEQDPGKVSRMNQRESNSTAISQSQQAAEIPAKRPRTRITDDQLKVLRANFDINTSPSEEQISEMAFKTNLPPKVIKHWFRNTLFKERQRSKDSPYNFNIPPMTSLDDVKDDFIRSSDVSREESLSNSDERRKEDSNSRPSSVERRLSEQNMSHDSHGAQESQAQIPDNPAMRIFKSLSEAGSNAPDLKQSIFSSLVPSFQRGSEVEKSRANSIVHGADLSCRTDSEKDQMMRRDALSEVSPFAFNRTSQEFSYPNSTQSNISTITRRTPRTRFSDYQLKVLQEFFDKNAYPKDEDLDKLSRMLELSTRVIVVWFQNARQKARKSYEMQQGALNSSHHPNGLAALSNYSRKRHSPPTSPSQTQILPNSNPKSFDAHSKGYGQFSRDLNSTRVVSSSGFPIPVKKEPKLPEASDSVSHECHHCDAVFATLEALQHHERLHASSHIPAASSQFKMSNFSPIIESMVQASSGRDSQEEERDSGRPSSKSPDDAGRRSSRDILGGKSPFITPRSNQTIGDIISRFGFPQMKQESHGNQMKPEFFVSGIGPNATGIMSQQFMSQAEGLHGNKSNLPSPDALVNASMSHPNGNRGKLPRKGINDNAKDPKRLRTTITPEQLEFLYQQYLVDSSPSRKVIEQISELVGLKKRVVQVWFQNTRARERKGQFRSVGRITLGMPQICPHCRVTFRTKADLDAHVRYRHMQSPSAVALSNLSQTHAISSESAQGNRSPTLPVSSFAPTVPTSSRDEATRSPPGDKVDYREIFQSLNKQIQEKYFGQSDSKRPRAASSDTQPSASAPVDSANSEVANSDQPCSPKRRKTSDGDPDVKMPFVTLSSPATHNTTFSSKTAEIYKAVAEQIFGPKASSVDAIAQRLQGKVLPTDATNQLDGIQRATSSSAFENQGSPPMIMTSSPESISSSTGSSFMVPYKRYRTQMSSLQVRSLKHCFAEYKTPTLLECEILGAQINLPKRVIQVWFQNARAKEKKSRQGDQIDPTESPMKLKTSCSLCPEMRFGSQQEYRNHFFSQAHLQNYMNSCDRGDGSDDQNRCSPTSEPDEYPTSKEDLSGSGQQRTFSPSPSSSLDDPEHNKFRMQAFTTNDASSENPPHHSEPAWSAYDLATNPEYQKLIAMQKIMTANSTQNGSGIPTRDSDDPGLGFGAPKQAWIQQALLGGRMGSD